MKTISKVLSIVLCLTLVMALFVIGASAADASAAISFSDKADRTVFNDEQQVWQQNGITVTNDKADSTNKMGDFAKPVRLYKNSKLTIAYPGMTQIDIYCNSASYATACLASIDTSDANVSAVANDKIVTITLSTAVDSFVISAMSAQVRVDSITVQTAAVSACQHTNTEVKSDDAQHWTVCSDCNETIGEKVNHTAPSCSCGYKEGTVNVAAVLGNYYKVTGQVVYINGDNYYLQDSTGAICAYAKNVDTSNIKVGDWVSVVGYYKLYNGLPELDGVVSVEAASAGTPGSPVTAIADIGIDDLCKPFTLTNLTVMSEKNGNYTLSDGTNTIIFRNLAYNTENAPAVGDKIASVSGIISVYKKNAASLSELEVSNIQLFNDKNATTLAGCSHETTTPKFDAEGHWSECAAEGCDYKTEKVAHTLTYKVDGDKHYQECECGYKSEAVAHELTAKYDTANHWSECVCGHITEKIGHTFNEGKCECGYEKNVVLGYYKVTDGKLTDGQYVLVINDTKVAAGALDGTWVSAATPTISGNSVTNTDGCVWTLNVEGSKVTITDSNGKTLYHSKTNIVEGDTAWNWKYENGKFYFYNDDAEKPRYFSSVPTESGANRFRAYYLTLEPDSYGNFYYAGFDVYKYGASDNANTGDTSVISVAIAAAVLSVMGCAVVINKKKEF